MDGHTCTLGAVTLWCPGKGFLFLKATEEARVTVVYNWLDEVRAQMRGKGQK
jgi:hypothetical protein